MSEIQSVAKRLSEIKSEKLEVFTIELPIYSIDGIPGDFSLECHKYPEDYHIQGDKDTYSFCLLSNLYDIIYEYERSTVLLSTVPTKVSVEGKEKSLRFSPEGHLYALIHSVLPLLQDVKWVERCDVGRFVLNPEEEIDEFDVLRELKNITLNTTECSVCYQHTVYQTDCAHALCAKCAVKCVLETDNGCPVCRREEFLPLRGIDFKKKTKFEKASRDGYY